MAGKKLPLKQLPIALQSIINHVVIMRELRRKITGTKLYTMPLVLAIGSNQGSKLTQLARLLKKSYSATNMYKCRVIKTGLIYRDDNKCYHLTERGQLVYDTFTAEYNKQFELIIAGLKAEIRNEFIASKLEQIAA